MYLNYMREQTIQSSMSQHPQTHETINWAHARRKAWDDVYEELAMAIEKIKERPELVRRIVERNPGLDISGHVEVIRALEVAVKTADVFSVFQLIHAGADVNFRYYNGDTLLHFAMNAKYMIDWRAYHICIM